MQEHRRDVAEHRDAAAAEAAQQSVQPYTGPEQRKKPEPLEIDQGRKIFSEFANAYDKLLIALNFWRAMPSTDTEGAEAFFAELRKPLSSTYENYLKQVIEMKRKQQGLPPKIETTGTTTVELTIRESDAARVQKIDEKLKVCEEDRQKALGLYEQAQAELRAQGQATEETQSQLARAVTDLKRHLEELDAIVKG